MYVWIVAWNRLSGEAIREVEVARQVVGEGQRSPVGAGEAPRRRHHLSCERRSFVSWPPA
jgi:hypothetical protein